MLSPLILLILEKSFSCVTFLPRLDHQHDRVCVVWQPLSRRSSLRRECDGRANTYSLACRTTTTTTLVATEQPATTATAATTLRDLSSVREWNASACGCLDDVKGCMFFVMCTGRAADRGGLHSGSVRYVRLAESCWPFHFTLVYYYTVHKLRTCTSCRPSRSVPYLSRFSVPMFALSQSFGNSLDLIAPSAQVELLVPS